MSRKEYFLTPQGAHKLRQELEQARGPKRQALAERLRHAIQQGDLSENADYSAAKEEQAFLEGRIQELEEILRNAVIVEQPTSPAEVGLGSAVTVQEDGEAPETFHLVGMRESDPRRRMVSYQSPIGQALLGKRVGEVAQVDTPDGPIAYRILSIEVSESPGIS